MRHARETLKRHRHAALSVAALLVVLTAGCDNRVDVQAPRVLPPTIPTVPTLPPAGAMVTENRPIAGVDSVALKAVGVVDIEVGGSESLTITAPERVMSLLTSDVSGGLLELDRNSASYQGQVSDIHYEVSLVRLDEMILEGAGQIDARGIDSGRFVVRMDGVGGVKAVGRADRQEVRMAGLGTYDAPQLISRVTEVHLTSGTAVICAEERIEGYVGFGSTLEYWGDPKVSVRGEGQVIRLGTKS